MSYRGKFDLYRNGMGGYLSEMTMERNSDLDKYEINKTEQYWISAPTFSQAFRWFRERYLLHHEIACGDNVFWFRYGKNGHVAVLSIDTNNDSYWSTYEEAELECLKKLIQIVKTQP
jgi:hypothetical protein